MAKINSKHLQLRLTIILKDRDSIPAINAFINAATDREDICFISDVKSVDKSVYEDLTSFGAGLVTDNVTKSLEESDDDD